MPACKHPLGESASRDETLHTKSERNSVARGGATGGGIDSDLLAIIEAWAELPETAKANILAIVQKSQRGP